MSGFSKAKAKLKEGSDWRGEITVDIDDEPVTLCVRQLTDPQMEEVMALFDRDEIEELRSQYPDDVRDELDDLRDKEDLTDEEEERRSELQSQMEDADVDIFGVLSEDTFEAVRLAAIYGVEPDDEDMANAMRNRAHEIEREYGIQVKEPEDTRDALKDEWETRVRSATDFASFEIGMECLTATVGNANTSEN